MMMTACRRSLLGLVLLALAAEGAWTDGDAGVDHMYSDIDNLPMTTNTTAECASLCAAAPGGFCVGWVVVPAGPCGGPICYRKSAMGAQTANACRISGFMPTTLLPQAFESLPLGSVSAAGWLADELRVQAGGLTSHLALFWPDIQNSTWVGGDADGGLHERAPYWLNGLVPLSFLIDDATVSAQRDEYLNAIMAAQQPSGWLGPDDAPTDGNQYWSRINVVLSLLQNFEATGDARTIGVVFRYLAEARRRLAVTPLAGWATVRAQDLIWSVWWLVDRFDALPGVPAGFSQAWLIDFADTVHGQMLANGGDWKTYFDTTAFPETPACVPGAPCDMLTHGVNIGQAIKSEAVWFRRSSDATDVDSTFIRRDKLDKFHGAPSGMFMADEHLAGSMPSHGTETCAVVEAIVSYAVAGEIIGDASLYERAERIAYNAMPAAMTKDWWERVYLQQPNSIAAIHEDPHVFFTDGADSATFSLEGNYGCCTANMHAGLPKFAQRAVAAVPSVRGVAVAMWAPVDATTPYARVSVATAYPFGDDAVVTVTPPADGRDVPVWLRIPSWADAATLSIDGAPPAALPAGSNGTFFATVAGGGGVPHTFALAFNPRVRVTATWPGGAASVERGALLYSLFIGQNISVTATHAFESKDLAVRNEPALPWNVALVLTNPANPEAADLVFTRVGPPSSVPFNSTAVPQYITGSARVVAAWGVDKNAAEAPPPSPACGAPGACGAPLPVTLVPFGSTHIRMSVLPWTAS